MKDQDRSGPHHEKGALEKKALEQEFVAIFSTHSSRLYAFILTLVVRAQDADEVFQATSMVLWRKFATYQRGTNFWSWACQVAYYEVLKHREASGRLPVFSDETVANLTAELATTKSAALLRKQALGDCLQGLDSRNRELMELRYYDGLPPKKIAAAQHRSQQSVYRSLNKVHHLLHECIEKKLAKER